MANNIGQVQVVDLRTGKTRFFNFGTWAHQRKLEKESGQKLYKLIKTIPASGSNTRSIETDTEQSTQPVARSMANHTPPPRKKKSCNC